MTGRKPILDYYKILGLDASASQEEIRASYRRLVKKFHPDVTNSKEAGQWMRLINEAYEVLSDKRKRAIYDFIFLVYSRFSTYEKVGRLDASNLLSMSRQGRLRYILSIIIVQITGLKHSLDLVFMSLLIFATALYVLFGQGELAAGLISILLISAAIALMVRVIAEFFDRAGICQAGPGFNEMIIAFDISLKRTSEGCEKIC